MAYTPHTLLTFGGTMGSGGDAETWQAGIRLGMAGGAPFSPLADLTGYASSITGGLTAAWHTAGGASAAQEGFPASWAPMTWFKVANIGADGKYSGATDTHGGPNPVITTFANQTGVSTVGGAPPFCTLAVSFHTDAPTKYARHGRIYAPLTVVVASGSSRASNTAVSNAAAWGGVLLTAIAKPVSTGANTGAIRPVVASRHGGEIFQITQIRVGNVIDVQRRRKKSLREAYTLAPWS